jgi:type II secretion system protein J
MRFVRGGHMGSQFNPEVPGIQTLEYWFTDNNFVRRSYSRPDATEETPVSNMPLVDGLTGLSVRFRVQGTWVDGLEAIVGSRQSLPELVELTFAFSNAETLTRVFAVGVNG